jgi:hypothetical protein
MPVLSASVIRHVGRIRMPLDLIWPEDIFGEISAIAPRRQQFVRAPSLFASQPGLDSQDSNVCYHADIFCGHYSAAKDLSGLAKEIDFICRALFFAPCFCIDPRPVFTHGGSGWPLVSGANGRISSPTT